VKELTENFEKWRCKHFVFQNALHHFILFYFIFFSFLFFSFPHDTQWEYYGRKKEKEKLKIIYLFIYIVYMFHQKSIHLFVNSLSMLVTPCNALGCGHCWNQACLVQPILILVMPMPLSVNLHIIHTWIGCVLGEREEVEEDYL